MQHSLSVSALLTMKASIAFDLHYEPLTSEYLFERLHRTQQRLERQQVKDVLDRLRYLLGILLATRQLKLAV